MAERCENCKYFFKSLERYSKDGFCRRFPQRIVKYMSDWCGEFKEAKK